MQFTRDDFEKIKRYLSKSSTRDSEFPLASPLTGCELVAIVQNGVNKKITVREFSNRLNEMDIPDFYNVTSRHKVGKLTLKKAIEYVPANQRMLGMVITFKACDGNWYILQFKGESINQWDNLNMWKEIFEVYIEEHMVYPDEEDITGVQDTNRKFLKLKDREYNPDEFSGKGRKILRKNLEGTESCSLDDEDHYENIISQKDFTESNTSYVLRYDYKLVGNLRIPDNCELIFEGGTITGGILDLNQCKLIGMTGPESDYFIDTNVRNWAIGQIEYRDNEIKYWDGEEWRQLCSKETVLNMIKNEINNTTIEQLGASPISIETLDKILV